MANIPKLLITDQMLALRNGLWKPQALTALFTLLARQHFGDANNIEQQTLQNIIWKSDETTAIMIEAIGRWKPTLTEKRLAVIVKRNGQKVIRMGINDRMMAGLGPQSTREFYATYIQGSHTLFCLGKESAETEILAAEVYRDLLEFGPKIRELMCLHKFVCVEVGELALLEESAEHFVVPVTIGYTYEECWEITQPSTGPLRRIDLNINAS